MTAPARALAVAPARAFGTEIIDSIELPIMVVGCDCTVASFNQAAAAFFSLGASDVGRSLCEIPVLSNVKRLEELCADAIARGASSQGEVRDATGSWFVLRIAPYKGSDQQIAGTVLTLTNVTALRATLEQAVYEREYTKAILNTVIDPLVVLDEDLQIQTANHAFYTMFQVSREETQGVRLYDLGNADWTTRLGTLVKESRSTNGQFDVIEVEHEFPTIGRRTVLLNARRLSRRGNLRQMTLLAVQDITERKQTEEALQKAKGLLETRVRSRTAELHAANEELKNEIVRRKGLEGQILEISDREQERLGQELHDGLCQQLTAIGFLARATALRLQNHRVVRQDDLEKIAQLINSSVTEVRNIARYLHKEEISAAEFLPALRNMVDRKIWKTPCRLELKTEVNIEDDKVASQLYRILREAVINANKHARATQIVLEVRRVKNELVFSVTDNGVGFNKKTNASHGLGFHIMQNRAESIGARLERYSPKKQGAQVSVYLPLPK